MSTAVLPKSSPARYPGRRLLQIRRNPLGFLEELAAHAVDDVGHVRFGPQHVVLLTHPDAIRDVLVTDNRLFVKGRGLERAKLMLGNGLLTSEGDFHLRQRRLAQPAFHRQRIAAYGETMVRFAAERRDAWRNGARIDVAEEMMALTLVIAAETLFGADVASETAEIREAVAVAFELFGIAMLPFSELIERLPLPIMRRFRQARARLDATIYRIIAARRAAAKHGFDDDREDLLSMLLAAQDTEGDGGRMTNLQLRDEVMTLFLAGHETTANLLSWTFHLLASAPDAERAMHAELQAVLGGRQPEVEDLPALPYTRAVLAESMRLRPPAYVIGRRALADYAVGRFVIPEGTLVLLSQWTTHRDPRWWPEAGRFLPERWLDADAAQNRPRMAYFPFGAGTRVCIGEQFAWMEGMLVLATLAQRWQLRSVPDVKVEPQARITLRPKGGLPMVVVQR